jgi:hypothetical protein
VAGMNDLLLRARIAMAEAEAKIARSPDPDRLRCVLEVVRAAPAADTPSTTVH